MANIGPIVPGIPHTGVYAITPPSAWTGAARAPAVSDMKRPGDLWVDEVNLNAYIQLGFANGGAVWDAFAGSTITVQTLTGDTGTAHPVAHNILIAGGTGAVTAASGSTVTVNVVGGGVKYTVVTADTQMAVNSGYITNKSASRAVMTLPATAAVGSVIRVVGLGSQGWSIAQNAGQTIHIVAASSTTGTGGSVASIERYDSIDLVCVVANTDWVAEFGAGTWTTT